METENPFFERLKRCEVIWRERLSLENGKVDFDLVQPACMNWSMNDYEPGIAFSQASDARLATMRRTIVDYKVNAACLVVGGLAHHLCDKPLKGDDARLRFAATKEFRAMHVHRRQVRPGTTTLVLVFNLHDRARPTGQGEMNARSCLDTGFLIGRENKFVSFKRSTLPNAFIEVENTPGLDGKVRVARKDPAAMLPGTDRIFVEPAPNGAVADRCDNPSAARFSGNVSDTPAREWQVTPRGEFTSERLNLNDYLWGEKPEGDPGGSVLQAPAGVP